MKKNLFLVTILFLGTVFNASAKQIQVNVLNFQFSPKNFTANIGDTIHFVWVAGFHTTTSTSIPSGAIPWDQSMDNSNVSFLYPVKTAGSYSFQCDFHVAMGMVGSFTVAAPPQSWNTTGNNNVTSASILGTTINVPLKFYTNSTQRMVIDSIGRVGIGTSTPINLLTVKLSGSTPVASWLSGGSSPAFMGFGEEMATGFNLATAANAPGFRPVLNTRRSRGTLASPTAVQNNDFLASFVSSGYDGSNFQNPATIDFFVDGAPSSGNVPARISFVTGTNQGNRMERLKVGSTGNFTFNNNQLFIQQSNGGIGIGTITPSAKLDIQNPLVSNGVSVNNSLIGNQNLVGIYSFSVNHPGWGYGVQSFGGFYGTYSIGQGGNSTGPVYGVYGEANGSAGSRYGVYGFASGGTFNAAGYFNGEVWASAYNVISDRKFKTDIAPIKNPIEQVMKLKPSTYIFKKDDIAKMGLPAGNQLGLIADEVRQVFPELVKDAVQPAKFGNDKTEILEPEVKYESVNYIGLIPVLIASTQVQQKQIDLQQAQSQDQQKEIELQQAQLQDQQKQIEELKEMIKQLSPENNIKAAISNVSLEQNIPNPLDNFTNIGYSIPAGCTNAQLIVTDINGKIIKRVQLGSAPNGNVSFDATGLSGGSYTYSIIVDGKMAETKKMVVAKNRAQR